VPRDSIIGPGFLNLDFSLMKDTKLTEKLNMQFRAEFFNILNHPSFMNPNPGTSGIFTGGAVPLANPPQDPSAYQPGGSICATYGTCYNPNGGKIVATAVSSRQIQFAVKFTF
jgi:hypothetical protein